MIFGRGRQTCWGSNDVFRGHLCHVIRVEQRGVVQVVSAVQARVQRGKVQDGDGLPVQTHGASLNRVHQKRAFVQWQAIL